MLVSGVVAGAILGFAVGREWRRLAMFRVRFLPLLVGAFLVRGVAPLLAPVALPFYLASITATGLVALANGRLPGAILIAAGSALNVVVIAANGGMPVDVLRLAEVGGAMPVDVLHIPLTGETHLRLLADILQVPVVRALYSVGDVLIAAGGFTLSFITLARR